MYTQSVIYLFADKYSQQPYENKDPFYKNLITFRSLGAKKIVQCLTEVCPLISRDGYVTNMDYLLSFLEFYDTLLLCAFAAVDKKLQLHAKKEMQEASAEKVIVEIEKIPSNHQQKKSQKKKQSKGK